MSVIKPYLIALFVLCLSPAYAQSPSPAFGGGGGIIVQQLPSQQNPAAPAPLTITQPIPPTTTSSEGPPRLHPCGIQEAVGVWKLVRVLEQPEASRTQDFKDFPFQYIWMTDKQRAFIDKYNQEKITASDIKHALAESNKGQVFQYTVGEKGVLYIYLNQAFSHSFYCAISEEAVGIYRIGDMVLTPTTPSSSKLFEVYRQVISP